MSISALQASQATVSLQLYQQALKIIQESARRQNEKQIIESFSSQMFAILKSNFYRKLCDPMKSKIWNQKLNIQQQKIVNDVKAFQFSHYLFSKYLSEANNHRQSGNDLISYLTEQNNLFESDLNKTY